MIINEKMLIASGLSSLNEVIFTHPLDYAKTLKQSNKLNYKNFIKNPYVGFKSRILGIIPLRVVYWNSINYFNKKGYNSLTTGIMSSILQTIIDYPIEQIKINKMLNKKVFFNNMGFQMLLLRNTLFCVGFTYSINNIDNNYNAAIGGLIGSIISHPIDSLKTWYQTGNKHFPKWNYKRYLNGLFFRSSTCIIGMQVGYFTYNYLIN